MEKRKYTTEEVFEIMQKHSHSIYYNKNDLNIFIKRPHSVYSWTMNLANKWSYIITISLAVAINILVHFLFT